MATIQLPDCCGVLPLPDCTLFPHGGLPLHISAEPYRRMLAETMAGSCFFAVARALGRSDSTPGGAEVAPVGTIGLVRASREQADGSSQVLLHGVMRVRFTAWHDDRNYPFANIEPLVSSFTREGQALAAMKTLRGAVEDAIHHLPEPVQTGVFALLDRADEPGLMTDIIAQQFIHEPDVRQKLLEMESIGCRIPIICDYLRRASAAAMDNDGSFMA